MNKWRSFVITVLFWGALYFGASFAGVSRGVKLSLTPIDVSTPFLVWSVWIYIFDLLTIPIAFALMQNKRNWLSMSGAIMTAVFISSVIFLTYPTCMLRPRISGDGMTEDALRLVYSLDAPTNCFPSLHVSLMLLVSIYLWRECKKWGFASWVFAILVAVSTLTTKQHYFVDVLGGFIVASVSVLFIDRFYDRLFEE